VTRRRDPRRSTPDPPAAGAPEAPASKLAGMRPIAHDEDVERPTREDRDFGRSPLDIPVPLPKFLRPKSMRRN
jgi:hypothetical protein